MQYLAILLPLLLSVVLATYIIPRILVVSVKKDLVVPSETRDKGRLRVPRLGGVSLFPILVISVGATMVCLVKFHILPLIAYEDSDTFVYYMFGIAGLTMMYLLGVMDDLLGVSLTSRLVIEVLAAALIPLSGLWLDDLHGILGIFEVPWWFGIPMTIFTIIYISNAITMLDDVDGLAAGTAMIAFAVLGFLALYVQEYLLLMICATMIGMLIPFFYRNVMERRIGWRNIYLGGTGGLVIGYVLSFVVIALSRMGGTSLPEGIIMMCFGTLIIPMFDVLRVAITRLVNGRNIFRSGDRNHIHHRLMTAGLSPRMVLLALLLISLGFISLNVIGVSLGVDLSLLLVIDVSVWLVIQVIIMYYKNKGERRHGLRR